jgi:hypothetical protein
MTVTNPFASDPERAAPFEQGYIAGYAEPDNEQFPPLEGEMLDIFKQGEQAGRGDRQREALEAQPLPTGESSDFSRFESAPDGSLVPIPDTYPPGTEMRSDAAISISVSGSGFYVAIFNGPSESSGEFAEAIGELSKEAAITRLEHLLAEAAFSGAKGVLKFGGIVVGVLISVFTPSPILLETRFRGFMEDGRPVAYVVLTPQP